MRKFVDLHVLPKVQDEKSSVQMAELLALCGYSMVGITLPSGLPHDKVQTISNLFHERGIETTLRIDLAPTSREELLRLLRRYRNSYDIVAVKCLNQQVAMVACRDRRVDVVFFDPHNPKVIFNHSLASLLQGALEFNLAYVIAHEESGQILTRLTKEVKVARDRKSAIALSSGSTSPMMIRAPLQTAAVASAIGLGQAESVDGVSEVPLSIISRNVKRRSPEYVEEGVMVVLRKGG